MLLSIFPALQGPKQDNFPKFKDSLENTVNYRPAWNIKNIDKILRK